MYYRVKIVILGDEDVGKTSVIKRFTENVFPEEKPENPYKGMTIEKRIQIFETPIVFEIVDFNYDPEVCCSEFYNARACIAIYDVTDPESLQNTRNYIGMADRFSSEDLKKYICGNKSDLERVVTDEEIEQLFERINIDKFFEVSAKSSEGIDQMFLDIAYDICYEYEIENQRWQNRNKKSKKDDKCVVV